MKFKLIYEVYSNGFVLSQVFIKYNNFYYSSDFDTTFYIFNIFFFDVGIYFCFIRTDSKFFELYVIGKEQIFQIFDYFIKFLVFLGYFKYLVIAIVIGR